MDPVQTPLPRNPELELLLFEDFYSREAWQVYADWLQQRGVPYGERIALELQLAEVDSEARATLEEQIDQLDAAHRAAWMGREFEPGSVNFRWERGFIIDAKIFPSRSMSTSDLLRALFAAPCAQFLRWLHLYSQDPGTEALSSARPLEALRKLVVHVNGEVGPLGPWLSLAPRLAQLEARGRGIIIDTLDHPRLEQLSLATAALPEPTVRAIGRCRLPKLHTLHVHFGSSRDGARGSNAMLEELYTARGVPRLLRLGLMNAEFQDEIAESIAESKLLEQLTHLYLSLGNLTDAGAAAILGKAERFAHLQHLDLSHNFISPQMCGRLRAALPMAELRDQKRPRR